MVLFSGNGDFRSLVEAVQRRGVPPSARPGQAELWTGELTGE
jgi:hypothetical protein